ncbi:hypothetical protein QR680_014381 [Steinernema hermaphroditum]|uniref:Uncharacterized protein n=1 Tax=Steinernema hermaphroditum TaxID=289476 RepID=A0AA39I8N7_9BILA|nr:hypothetical protein QR680_014381 [Steinernema hermaphroditum]
MFGRDPLFALDHILNAKTSEDTSTFRKELTLAIRNAWDVAKEHSEAERAKNKERYDKSASSSTIQIGDRVFLRNERSKPGLSKKLTRPWIGTYREVRIEDPYAFIVCCENPLKDPKKVHINQLKIFLEPSGPAASHKQSEECVADALTKGDTNDQIGNKRPARNHNTALSSRPRCRYNLRSHSYDSGTRFTSAKDSPSDSAP